MTNAPYRWITMGIFFAILGCVFPPFFAVTLAVVAGRVALAIQRRTIEQADDEDRFVEIGREWSRL